MDQDEPRMLFGRPLTSMMGIMGAALLFSQIFALMCLTFYLIFYFMFALLCFSMLYFLSVGIKKKKAGAISAYSVFLLCYIMWTAIASVFWTLAYVDVIHEPYVPYNNTKGVTQPPNTRDVHKGYLIFFMVLMLVASSISLLISIYQLRLCILFTRYLRSLGTDRFNVSYQTRFGAPPPWGNIPQNVQNNSQQAGPLPDKPPSYADVTNTGVTVEQPTSLAQSSVVLEPTSENTQQAPPPSNQQQPAASTGHDDLDTILGRMGPPVIQTGSIMGGAFEAHSPTLPVETMQFQQNASPDVTVFSDPFDPQVETSTLAATSAELDVAADSSLGFVPSPTNPFALDCSAGHSNTAQSEVSTETQELGLFEDIYLN